MNMKQKKQKVNILYERVSKDNELQGTSNSILNQQQLLEERNVRTKRLCKHSFQWYLHLQYALVAVNCHESRRMLILLHCVATKRRCYNCKRKDYIYTVSVEF